MLILKPDIQLTVLRSNGGLLSHAMSSTPAANLIIDALKTNKLSAANTDMLIAIPEEWNIKTDISDSTTISSQEDIDIYFKKSQKTKRDTFLTISNGRFITEINKPLIDKFLNNAAEDVILINAKPELLAYHEKIRFTNKNNIVGFRRLYSDTIEPGFLPNKWPHHVTIKTSVLNKLFSGNTLPCDFAEFINMCSDNALTLTTINVGGIVLDMETENGLLNLCKSILDSPNKSPKNATSSKQCFPLGLSNRPHQNRAFRTWPKYSYSQFLKRLADIIGSITVIILFAPIVPFIALVLKMNSPGPLFFKAKRQGLGGKEFYCIKFRTMMINADQMQDKLRVINQIDGPQFKIDEDPRVSSVGRFLRNTYIDEIPQFFNVLLGQMSIVGPRPSPESENILCAQWRDARLSVRPGITGLWQACRTRKPSQDFQEWIYYDIKYVKKISLKLDLWICWETAKHMLEKFADQF